MNVREIKGKRESIRQRKRERKEREREGESKRMMSDEMGRNDIENERSYFQHS